MTEPDAIPPFRPSQVRLTIPPLVDTMGRSERENAAALMVRACAANGDTWGEVRPQEVGALIKADLDENGRWARFHQNPFVRFDVWDLVKHGYARWTAEDGGPSEFTVRGIEAMRKWVTR